MMRRHLSSRVMVVVAIAAMAACSSNETQKSFPTTSAAESATTTIASGPSDNQSSAAQVPTGFDSLVTTDGVTRTYRVVDSSGDEESPLLFVLHGFGGTADDMRRYTEIESRLENTADFGVIVVYPNGTGGSEGLPQSWNAGGCCPFATLNLVDDVAFFDQMITKLAADYDVDTKNIWVMGHSNGGMMAYRLACELSSRITAIGVAAGSLMIDTCVPTQTVSSLHVHGELDSVVPIAGGETAGITFPSAQTSYRRFAEANSCTISGQESSCSNDKAIRLVTDASWTHDWQPQWTTLFADFFASQYRD